MYRQVLLDTGSLVALLNRRDNFHEWAKLQWQEIEPPLLTCEPVISSSTLLNIKRLGWLKGKGKREKGKGKRKQIFLIFKVFYSVFI